MPKIWSTGEAFGLRSATGVYLRCVGILLITRKEDEAKPVKAKPPDARHSVTSLAKFKAYSSVSKESQKLSE
jgi:hypothetical protein